MPLASLLSLQALGLLLVAWYTISSLASWYRLRHFSGPFLGRFSYLFMIKTNFSGRMNDVYTSVSRTYGQVARIGPNELITDDPELLRRMSSARSSYSRSSWYVGMSLDPYEETMMSQLDTAAHDKLKAMTAFGYGGKENPDLETGIDEQLDNIVRSIRKYIARGQDLDFARVVQFFTLDSITRISYGREFGFLETDSDVHEYIATTEGAVPFLQMCSEVPYFGNVFLHPKVLDLVGPKPTDKKGIGRLMMLAKQVVSKRYGPDAEDHQDMLGAFVRHGLTRRQCETEVLFQIIAGSDTTATVLRSTMMYIITIPRVYGSLRQEIDTAFREGKLSSPIGVDEAKQLPYLQAVIYEGLRMHPPFTGLLMKQVPPEGDTYQGKFLPGGTRIGHSTWSATRNKTIFGNDVELFRPERWLEAGIEERQNMVKTTELAFGYGRWGCAGKSVAFIEMNKFYVELLKRFDFQLVNPMKAWKSRNNQLFMQSDMWVKVTERELKSGVKI